MHSELFPGSSAAPKLSGANAAGCIVRSHTVFTHGDPSDFLPGKDEKAVLSHTFLRNPKPPDTYPPGGMQVVVVGRAQASPPWEPPLPHTVQPTPPTPTLQPTSTKLPPPSPPLPHFLSVYFFSVAFWMSPKLACAKWQHVTICH